MNRIERYQWKKPGDIRRFPELVSPDWDNIIPLLIVLPGYKYPEVGFFVSSAGFTGLWFQYNNSFPVQPTHWQQLPKIPNKP